MSAQHTPTPYVLDIRPSGGLVVRGRDGIRAVAEIWHNGDDPKLTGEFVVKACNQHDRLLSALKLIVQTCDDYDESEESTNECIAAVDAARVLIAETEA